MRPRYFHKEIGINSRLDTIQAVALVVKIKRLQAYNQARQEIANRYDLMLAAAGLVDSGAIELPFRDPAAHHVWNQYSLRIRDGRRDALRQHLAQHQIGTETYYPVPLHEQVCFKDLGYQPKDLPVTHQATKEILHLPIFPGLTQAEQQTVVYQIAAYYQTAANRSAA
jgi:dTDP-4-amino-4,6-dideoxygalactose transaminase